MPTLCLCQGLAANTYSLCFSIHYLFNHLENKRHAQVFLIHSQISNNNTFRWYNNYFNVLPELALQIESARVQQAVVMIALGITLCRYGWICVCSATTDHNPICVCVCMCVSFCMYVSERACVCARACVCMYHIPAGIQEIPEANTMCIPMKWIRLSVQFDATPNWPLAFQCVFPIGHISLFYPHSALLSHRLYAYITLIYKGIKYGSSVWSCMETNIYINGVRWTKSIKIESTWMHSYVTTLFHTLAMLLVGVVLQERDYTHRASICSPSSHSYPPQVNTPQLIRHLPGTPWALKNHREVICFF